MKIITRSLALLAPFLPAILLAQPGYFQRSTLFEHTEPNAAFANAVETSDGSVLAALNLDTANYLVKLDQNGEFVWANAYPSSSTDDTWRAGALTATADGGAIVLHDEYLDISTAPNYQTFEVTATRLDAAGQVMWRRKYNAPVPMFVSAFPHASIVTHPNGEHTILLHGFLTYHNVLVRIDDLGNVIWSTYPDSNVMDSEADLLPGPDNGVLLVYLSDFPSGDGIVAMRFDQSGSMLWGKRIKMTNASAMYSNMNAGVIASGAVYLIGEQEIGQTDRDLLIRFEPNGDLAWYKLYDTSFAPSPSFTLTELTNGDLMFGSRGREYFTSGGTYLGHAGTSFPSTDVGNDQFVRSAGYTGLSSIGFLVSGNYKRTDQLFGYSWSTPTIERIPLDLAGTCGWVMDTSYAVTDTLVPLAFISLQTMDAPVPETVFSADTSFIIVPSNLAFFDFCALVGVEENIVVDQPAIEVFPSLVSAGDPVNLRTTDAAEVIVRDARGRIVWRDRVQAGLTQIPTSGLAAGLHVIHALDRTNGTSDSVRFVVE
ncbi:MAG: hypothetical protein KA175_08385 [Flavobacteriales bacterium]|nr:hypothetical protein [Flavobacteriales bacterium]